jgi:mannose-6-phosphate isomerase-like protein (cupin superfamily)
VEYLRKIDFGAFDNARPDERVQQWLIDHTSGANTCSISCIKTPAGGGSPAGLHVHKVDQLFYIVSGVMSIEIQGETSQAGAGTIVIFPAGVPHRNWNASAEPTVHLAINTPVPDPALPFATPAA